MMRVMGCDGCNERAGETGCDGVMGCDERAGGTGCDESW